MTNTVPKILIVGGGYAGFYTAWKLEKTLRKGEAEVMIVDPLPYMTYQPFLPEVAAGSIEARHAVVATSPSPQAHHRRGREGHRHRPREQGRDDHARSPASRTSRSTTRSSSPPAPSRARFPIPGIADNAIGLKTIEEAVAIRDRADVELRQGLDAAAPARSATACSPSSSSAAGSPASRSSPSCARSRRRSSRATRSSRSTTRTSTSSRRWAASCPRSR